MSVSTPSFPGLSFRRSHPELDHYESRPSIRPTPPTGALLPSATPPQKPRKRGAARFVLGIAAGLGLSITFIGAFAASLLLHLNAPSGRRAIAELASGAASRDLGGRIDIVSIDRISPRAIDVGEITVRDPAGRPVASVYGAHVRYNVLGLAKAFLAKGTPTIDRVVVDRVNVALIPNAEQLPTLIDAVASKNPKPAKGPAEKAPSTFKMAIPAIDVRAIEVWGSTNNMWISAWGDVEKLSVYLAPEGTRIVAPRVAIDVAPIANTLASATHVELDGAMRIDNHATEGDLPVLVDHARIAVSSGGTHATITATTDERSYSAHVEVPTITPATIAAFTGAPPPMQVPASLSLDIDGSLEQARVHGVAGVGAGTATVDGDVDLTAFKEKPSVEYPRIALGRAAVSARGIDPALFGGPSLGVSSDVAVYATQTMRGTELVLKGSGAASLDGKPGVVDVDAVALIAPNSTLEATGKVHAGVGRAKVDVEFALAKRGRAATAHAGIVATVPDLAELRALHQQPLRGRIDLEGAADVDLGKQTFAMSARARAIGVSHPSIHLPEGAVAVQAEGPFSEPKFVAAVAAPQLVLSPAAPNPYRLHDVDLRVAGTPKLVGIDGKLTTDANQKLQIGTHVATTATGARVIGTKLHVERDAFIANVSVGEVTLDGAAIEVKGLKMSSTAGGLRLDASYDPKRYRVSVEAASTPLDLPKLMHGAALDDLGLRGTLTINTKLATIARKNPTHGTESGILRLGDDVPRTVAVPNVTAPYVAGHLELDLDDGFAPRVGDMNAHVNVDVEDRLVMGDVGVAIKDLIRIGVHGGALVPGRIDDPKAWADASGHVDLRIPSINLEKVSAFLARNGQQAPALAGTLDISGRLERIGKDAPPSGFLDIDTHGFAMQSGTTRLDGIDFRVRTVLDGRRDHSGAIDPSKPLNAYTIVEARDNKGPLAILHVGTTGMWSKISAGGKNLADLPIAMNVLMPPREIDNWPRAVAKSMSIHGKLGVVGHAEGTIGAPKVEVRARLEDVADVNGGIHDANVTLTYDGALAKLLTTVTSRREPERSLLALDAEVKVKSADVIAGGNVPWVAKLDAKLDGLPLDLVAADTGVSGWLRGELHADHINDPNAGAATVDGRIDVDKLRVGDALFDETFLAVKVDDKAANATLAVRGKDGALDGKVNVPLTWKNAASPSVTVGAPIEASLDAKDLRLRIAEPFVEALDKLDGRLDAHVVAKVTKTDKGWSGAPEGRVTLRDGVIIADAVGERWDRVTADVTLKDNKITLPALELRGRGGGYAKISGNATLEGFFPKTFHGEINTKRFSFASEGAKVGDVTGKIVIDGKTVKLEGNRDQMVIEVTLDKLLLDLAAEAGKKVQALTEDPSIIVEQPLGPPVKPPAPPGTGTAMKVVVRIPYPILIRRDDLRVAATGNPTINIDGPARISGEIRIEANPASNLQQRSWVEVSGKRFYIQASRIAFAGNEDIDPLLDIEVRWQAPDRTIVQVKVSGHLTTPKVAFKALDESGSPLGLTQGEVMSLIVLGRRDAGSASQQQAAEKGAASQAATLIGGMTGAVLGKQLQKVLPASMSLSLAPGRSSAGFQHKNVYFEVAYNAAGARMGPQALGQTVPRTTFGIEWRFAKMWSLMTTIGDTGSTLVDLLWNYRY